MLGKKQLQRALLTYFFHGAHEARYRGPFRRKPELERALRDSDKHDVADMVRNIVPEEVHCIYLRQPEALGLGTRCCARSSPWGLEPFVVLLAGDVMRGDLPTQCHWRPLQRSPVRS